MTSDQWKGIFDTWWWTVVALEVSNHTSAHDFQENENLSDVEYMKEKITLTEEASVLDLSNEIDKETSLKWFERIMAKQWIEADTFLTYGSFLPALVDVYGLSYQGDWYSFSRIKQTSDLYEVFNTAYSLGMIGKDIDPSWRMRCKHMMVLLGLAEAWDVTNKASIFDAYWSYAQSMEYTTHGCDDQEAYARRKDIPTWIFSL